MMDACLPRPGFEARSCPEQWVGLTSAKLKKWSTWPEQSTIYMMSSSMSALTKCLLCGARLSKPNLLRFMWRNEGRQLKPKSLTKRLLSSISSYKRFHEPGQCFYLWCMLRLSFQPLLTLIVCSFIQGRMTALMAMLLHQTLPSCWRSTCKKLGGR